MTRGPNDGGRGGGRWQMRFDWADSAPDVIPIDTAPPANRVYPVAESPPPLPGEHRDAPPRKRRVSHPRVGGRVSSVLPVPKALPEAVAAGRFGQDEAGKPVRPLPDEVRAITEAHAEQLIEWLKRIDDATSDRKQRAADAFNAGIAKYAEDFGAAAAERLRAYCNRMADAPDRVTTSWRR